MTYSIATYAIFCSLVLASAGSSIAQAQTRPYADLVEVDAAVAQFTGAGIGHAGGARQQVDRRLRLKPCSTQLVLAWHGSSRDTVKVECGDSQGWRIFVAITPDEAASAATTKLIGRGDRVTVAVHGRGFTVTQTGEAMDAGAKGDWIRVRATGAKEPVRAMVEQPGLAIIPAG
ncbi:flagella basal body P-ring formation protein FlgA [Croceicoccus sp. F390]|uniref:Flagella basal body P-ring formation protein FlgA n=1 Tax=Croceicoccus esteveae TaxID=3075597 RepID=A0ABU2ZEB1_9SPHN|nr:flagella basal body P-ring formation protein FlgA [Croceicoccus sp. F390]MDT0574710.1 flagella basal body P-ring formation protein FlgA [Croceicoccus sp. F390]